MSIMDAENRLFQRWRQGTAGFVADGVVDEVAYLKCDLKILLVLKEVNDPKGGGWDLREFLRKGGRPHTWSNVARWLDGIGELPASLPWNEVSQVSESQRREALQRIAAMNLKKSPGGYTTVDSELKRAAVVDREHLRQQFALYRPDVVICCGTAAAFQKIAPPCTGGGWTMTSRGVEFYQYELGRYVIKYMHPEARGTTAVHYYGLMDAMRELLFSDGSFSADESPSR